MLSAHKPEDAVTTHPAVTVAVGELVREAGASAVIADSPAIDRFKRVADKSGLAEAAQALGAEIRELTDPVQTATPEGSRFQQLELARAALEADVVINVPKLKTHSLMLMTLGVKNMFGCVVGQRKILWHSMIGMDRDAFASLLLDIYRTLSPGLTVLDGITAMEGRGPANGRPRPVGLVAASTDALALDLAVCRCLGVPLKRFPLYRIAVDRGLIDPQRPFPPPLGDDVADKAGLAFEVPALDAALGRWAFLSNLFQRHLVSKPVQEPGECARCGKCVDMCAAGAIELDDRNLEFDYNRCIRCYCCQEVCPQDAIGFKTGPLIRLFNLLGR
jgi:uncharacterized protein (DUF362 family)/Pyruvate/2-oxoacid:ferredoxin oxidoreductase delta subunit